MNNSLVSVAMCTYNGSRFVAEQIESICRQTYTNLEIIIADDDSSDNTYSILKTYAEKDKRIRLYKNEKNLGFNLNFNKTCHLATGEFIAISDQDDIWHPEKLERMIQQWQPELSLMYCNSIRFTGEFRPRNLKENPRYRRFEGKDSRRLSIFNTISGHALLIKKDFLPLISPFPPNLMYDWYAGAVAACNGGVGYVKDILVYQRIHGSNISVGGDFDHNKKKRKADFKKMVRDHVAKFITIPGMPAGHVLFFQQLLKLWSKAMSKKFSWRLFFFLVKNSRLIFSYKKRKIGLVSYIKHSYRLASN